jgi:prepilin-type N-terminal cleavage/methylation domain-containing protein
LKVSYKNKKGFTLIELIVALSIAVIVISAVGSFLVSNLKSFNMANDQIDSQAQAKKALEFFTDTVMQGSGITTDMDSTQDYTKVTAMNVTGYGSFTVDRSDPLNIQFKYKALDDMDNTLIAQYLTSFTLEPLPQSTGMSFSSSNCTGVKITVTTKKNNAQVTLDNEVYFRNK